MCILFMYTIKTLITKRQKYSINDDYFQQNPVPRFLVRFSKLILCYIDRIYVLVRDLISFSFRKYGHK